MSPRRVTFDPAFATAAETVAAVRTKKISARELLTIAFDRIDRHNPALNAVVWQCREQALARAKQADSALARGKSTGALHGVPVTIKESFAYRGSPNTWGLPALEDVTSPRTAVAVERLESAGAIVIGKKPKNTPAGNKTQTRLRFSSLGNSSRNAATRSATLKPMNRK